MSRPVDDLVVIAEFRDPIYPGLAPTGRIERGGDRPCHVSVTPFNVDSFGSAPPRAKRWKPPRDDWFFLTRNTKLKGPMLLVRARRGIDNFRADVSKLARVAGNDGQSSGERSRGEKGVGQVVVE